MRQGKPLDPARPWRAYRAAWWVCAVYHLHVKNIGRRRGRSAVAAAAYRAGETLPNDAEEKDSAFGGKRDVVFTEIRLPSSAPGWMADRAKLWNAVEAAEKRKDARLAKEIEFALPRDLPREMWVEVARQMADAYVSAGHIIDIAIHDDGTAHNPHVHLLLTTRAVGPEGFGLKLRDADGVAFVNAARQSWERIANAALGKAGSAVQIDARSYAARGIDKQPTSHRGPDPAERRATRWRTSMNHDTAEARRELLGERHIWARFPLLSGRPDWPPERREPVLGLGREEAAEWRSFWHEVDKRMWGEELYPRRADDEQIRLEPRDADHAGQIVQQITDKVMRAAAIREATVQDAFPTWRELHAAINERMAAAGHRTDDSLSDWVRVESAMRKFHAQLTELQLRDAQHRAGREALPPAWDVPSSVRTRDELSAEPVPDPDGRPIDSRELDEAQDRLLADHGQRSARMAKTPRPERAPGSERAEARAAVERQNNLEVPEQRAHDYRVAPHESRLDWLDRSGTKTPAAEQPREDRLDWLKPAEPSRERDDGPERERDR